MKKLLLPVLLCAFTQLFAQSKDEPFIKKFLYVKFSPALYAFVDETDNLKSQGLSPAVFVTVGAKMRYAAAGFSIGRFKLQNAGAFTPTGIDLTITDFKKTVAPVLTGQWYHVPFTAQTYEGRYNTRVDGKNMYSVGAGGAFNLLKTMKMMVTAGVSKMNCNAVITRVALGPTQPASHFYFKGNYKILFISASLVW